MTTPEEYFSKGYETPKKTGITPEEYFKEDKEESSFLESAVDTAGNVLSRVPEAVLAPGRSLQRLGHDIWPETIPQVSSPDKAIPEGVSTFFQGANQQLYGMAAAPIELGNYISQELFDGPVLRENKDILLRDTMTKLTGDIPPDDSFIAKMGAETASAVVELGLLGLASKSYRYGKEFLVGTELLDAASAKAPGMVKKMWEASGLKGVWEAVQAGGKDVVDVYRNAPFETAAMDIGISPIMSLGAQGGEAAEKYIFGTSGGTGSLLGGVSTAASAQGIWSALHKIHIGVSGLIGDENTLNVQVGDMLRAADPDISTKLEHGPIQSSDYLSDPTLDQVTGSEGIASLRRGYVKGAPGSKPPAQVASEARQFEIGQQRQLLEGARRDMPDVDADRGDADTFFSNVVRTEITALERTTQLALDLVNRRLYELGGDINLPNVQTEASEIMYKQVVPAARAAEKEVWAAAGIEFFDVSDTKKAIRNVVSEMHPRRIDPILHEILHDKSILGDVFADTDAVTGARAMLLDRVRENNANGEYAKNNGIKEVLKVWDDSLKVWPHDPETKELYQPNSELWKQFEMDHMPDIEKARDFSRTMNDTITRGPLGRVLGYTDDGDKTILEGMFLQSLLSGDRYGTKSFIGAEAMFKAAQYLPETDRDIVKDNLEQYLRGAFAHRTLKEGTEFNPAEAYNFVTQHRKLLTEHFPELKAEFMDTAKGAKAAKDVDASMKRRIANLDASSWAAKYLKNEARTGAIISQKSKSKALQMTKSLMHAARQDVTGKAERGVKVDFFETMLSKVAPSRKMAVTETAVEAADEGIDKYAIDPRAFRDFLDHNTEVIKEVFGEAGYKVLREVNKGAEMQLMLDRARTVSPGSDTAENARIIAEQFAGGWGVILGGKLLNVLRADASHKLVLLGLFRRAAAKGVEYTSRPSNEKLYDVLEEALYDPKFAEKILGATNPEKTKELFKYLGLRGLMTQSIYESGQIEDDPSRIGEDITNDTSKALINLKRPSSKE